MGLVDDELECLSAIYSPEELVVTDLPPLLAHLNKRIALALPNDCYAVLVIPHAYPAVSPVVMKATYTWMTTRTEAFLTENFVSGNEVLLQVIQFLRDISEEASDADTASGSSVVDSVAGGEESGAGLDSAAERADGGPLLGTASSSSSDVGYCTSENGSDVGDSGGTTGLLSGVGGIFSAFSRPEVLVDNSSGGTELSTFYRYEPLYGNDKGEGDSAGSTADGGLCIHHGEPLVDRKSVFVGHVAAVSSMADVHSFREQVLSDKKVARATHNISAYRFTDAATSHHDFDDDGESAAGGRMAEMMRLMNLGGAGEIGVAVIVTRWYGGIKLGPDRFKLINNCARGVLEQAGYVTRGAANAKTSSKKK